MRRLEDVTGQQRVIDWALRPQNDESKAILRISGSRGSGISWAIDQLGKKWESLGGVALLARGDVLMPQQKFFPWLTIASPTKVALARLDILKGGLTQASKSVPFVGQVTSYLVDELLNHRKKRLAETTDIIGEKEQDLMYVLQMSANDKRLLLSIDHLDGWDKDSWSLLALILSSRLDESYPALRNAVFAIASQPSDERLDRLLYNQRVDDLQLNRLEKQDLSLAMEAFHFPSINSEYQNNLYDIATGRLDLLHDLGVYMQKSGSPQFSLERTSFYNTIIQRRLQNIKQNVDELDDLLAAGSFLGSSFSLDDLRCLTGRDLHALLSTVHGW